MFEGETRHLETRTEPAAAGRTARPAAKFLIGILAGASAVLLPRALALIPQSEAEQLVFFPAPYFLLALGVGAFISAMLAILRMRS